MINVVTNNPVKTAYESKSTAVPTAVSSSLSFKGATENGDTVELSAKKGTAEKIKEKSQEFSNNVDAVADSIDKTTDSVTNAVTKTTGAVALISGAFAKLIPAPIKDFFATPQFITDETGNQILQKVKGSDGIERVVRKFNLKNTGIALGVTAAVIGGIMLYKKCKNKPAEPPVNTAVPPANTAKV